MLGRNWLNCFKLDWKALHTIKESALNKLIDKYEAVFAPGLGTLKGFEGTIHVALDATHCSFQARSVPFLMRTLMEKEFNKLHPL